MRDLRKFGHYIILIVLLAFSSLVLGLSTSNAQTNRHVTDENIIARNKTIIEPKMNFLAKKEIIEKITRPAYHDLGTFTVTAYDLSTESCEKPLGSPGYGVTATGYNLTGHTWDSARVIAVDPDVIPLGSKIYVEFTEERMKGYNGIYTARDVGGAIVGNKIDFFMGDFNNDQSSEKTSDFGVRKAKLYAIK